MKNYFKDLYQKTKSHYNFFLNERRKSYTERKKNGLISRMFKSKWFWLGSVPFYLILDSGYQRYKSNQIPKEFYIQVTEKKKKNKIFFFPIFKLIFFFNLCTDKF